MFYDKFVELSNAVGKSPSAVALECGLSKPTVTKWKQGGKPTDATAHKIAEYFGVSSGYLLTGEEQKKSPAQAGGKISIEEEAERILSGLSDASCNTIMLDGKPASAEARDAFKNAIMVGIEMARKAEDGNKETE